MIRANRNNQRRGQRRPEHTKEDEEVVVEVAEEEDAKHQDEKDHAGGQAEEHEVKDHAKEPGPNGGEDKEYIGAVEVKAEESVQQQIEEETGNICGDPPEPFYNNRAPSEGDGNKERSENTEKSRDMLAESEAREEVPGLVYIDYSQFDEEGEVGSIYGLGGREGDSYNLSQTGANVDNGLTDEKVLLFVKEFIKKSIGYFSPVQRCSRGVHREDEFGGDSATSKLHDDHIDNLHYHSDQHDMFQAVRRRRHGGSVRRQPSILASLLPRSLRPHQRQPRRRRLRYPTQSTLAYTSTSNGQSLSKLIDPGGWSMSTRSSHHQRPREPGAFLTNS